MTTRPLNEVINDPAVNLVDVRTPQEVNEVGIRNAVNIPMNEVPQRLEEFRNMEGDIVVFCRSGARSEQVKQYLMQNGIQNVINAGGYPDVQIHLM